MQKERFVSSLGPDRPNEVCDVRFLESAADFKQAKRRREELQSRLDAEKRAVVIYRTSHRGDSYVLSRQIDFDQDGEQSHPGLPENGRKIGYDIFVVPASLLDMPRETQLASEIKRVCDVGQGPPSDVGPN